MMVRMKLYVARHTQTNYNALKLCNSDPKVDVHLTQRGIEQAKQLASELKNVKLDRIFISELPRTQETASYLQQYKKVPVIVDGRINDNSTGFENRPTQEYVNAFNNSPDRWHAKFNNGESLGEARQRVVNFLSDIRKEPFESVLVITHGFIIECINGVINNLDFDIAESFQVDQGKFEMFENFNYTDVGHNEI
jgi:broad specificity phosphatase PhoE